MLLPQAMADPRAHPRTSRVPQRQAAPDTSGAACTADAFADAIYASPQQLAALKRLARHVSDEASADVQDMLDHHPEGLVLGVYATVTQRLRARTAATRADAPVHQQG